MPDACSHAALEASPTLSWRRDLPHGAHLALTEIFDAWRRCCDHPQLTSFWRQMGQEMQLQGAGRAGVLTIAEANNRLADFAQNKLQVRSCLPPRSSHDICALKHAPAAMRLIHGILGHMGHCLSAKHTSKGLLRRSTCLYAR